MQPASPFALLCGLSILACVGATPPAPPVATFDWFEYQGYDGSDLAAAGAEYRNPILAGFYPDPSICRVGEDYYLVTSSFSYYPGVPIFHSRDLVRWRQIGHVLSRSSQLKLDGLGVSRGIFAPTLRYHDGTFFMITTAVDSGGNFFVTATKPGGPWSDPVWLPEIDGIDPSFFFDDDGKAYIVNNGPPPDGKPLYEGHRALWLQELDVATKKLVGPRTVLVNGGVDLAKHPIWIEGPHIFKHEGWYVLMAAEGGTAEDHSEVVFRSRDVRGPYAPWQRNPILTQRTLDPDRTNPVTSTGHADLVSTPDGAWWAVFLGCRPYAGRLYNTGRETFLLPVTWHDGWPMILEPGVPVPLVHGTPRLQSESGTPPMTGAFVWRDDFDGARLDLAWNSLRGPADAWSSLTRQPGTLVLEPRAVALTSREQPAFLGRRQQHANFTATAGLRLPSAPGYSAGVVAFQNETYNLYLGVRRAGEGAEVFLERIATRDERAHPEVVARRHLAAPLPSSLQLRIEGRGRTYGFAVSTDGNDWTIVKDDEDGSILSTATAGGFVGTYLGLYTRLETD